MWCSMRPHFRSPRSHHPLVQRTFEFLYDHSDLVPAPLGPVQLLPAGTPAPAAQPHTATSAPSTQIELGPPPVLGAPAPLASPAPAPGVAPSSGAPATSTAPSAELGSPPVLGASAPPRPLHRLQAPVLQWHPRRHRPVPPWRPPRSSLVLHQLALPRRRSSSRRGLLRLPRSRPRLQLSPVGLCRSSSTSTPGGLSIGQFLLDLFHVVLFRHSLSTQDDHTCRE